MSGCVLCGIQDPGIWVCSVWTLWPFQCLISGCPTYMLNRQSDFFLLLSKTVLRSQEATFFEFTSFVYLNKILCLIRAMVNYPQMFIKRPCVPVLDDVWGLKSHEILLKAS